MRTNSVFPTSGADPLEYFKLLAKTPSGQQDPTNARKLKHKLSPLEKIFKESINQPYNTKKYAFNNSVNMRTQEAELQTKNSSLFIFPAKRQSLPPGHQTVTNSSNPSVLKEASQYFVKEPRKRSGPLQLKKRIKPLLAQIHSFSHRISRSRLEQFQSHQLTNITNLTILQSR